MNEPVIIDCLRTPVGKAPRGTLRNTRPDDLGATVIRALLDRYPEAEELVEDWRTTASAEAALTP